MKRRLIHSKLRELSSFTLVELLVVITIIAILVGVLLSAVQGALNSAKRAKAANMASGIQTAAMSFYTEYSIYPVSAFSGVGSDYAVTDTASGAAAWRAIIEELSGNISPYTGGAATGLSSFTNNTRAIAFLSMKATDVDASDAPLNPLPTGTAIYFNMLLDGDYDGTLGATGTSQPNMIPDFVNSKVGNMKFTGTSTAGVIVWANCNGNAKKLNPNFYPHTF